MSLSWKRESPAYWDADKARIVGGAGPGVFDGRLVDRPEGALVPGMWWRVEEDGRVLGYGWMDVTWGDAEILLVTAADARRRGVGTFILDQLEREAHAQGLRYLTNRVRETDPAREEVTRWLRARRFEADEAGKLFRAVVREPSRPSS